MFSNPVCHRESSTMPKAGCAEGAMNPYCHGEALRAVAIQLDHHAWRSQARDDKHVFISRRASRGGDPAGLLRRGATPLLAMTGLKTRLG